MNNRFNRSEALRDCDWQSIIEAAAEKHCHEYHRLMLHKAKAAEADNDPWAPAYALIRDVASLRIDHDDPRQPFQPEMVWNGMRTFAIEDLTPDEVATLSAMADSIRDPEMRARLSDICWTLDRKQYVLGRTAARAYLDSAWRLAPSETPAFACDNITRAVQVAAMLGKGNDYDQVITELENAADRDDLHPMVAEAVLKELFNQRSGDAAKQRSIAERRAERCRDGNLNDPYRERGFLQLAEKLSGRLNDADGAKRAKAAAAESHLNQAAVLAASGDPTASAAVAHHLEHGLHALKQVPGTENRRDDVHRQLLETQFAQSEQMGRITANTDISDSVWVTREYVRGAADPQTALFRLALIARSPSVEELRAEVLDAAKRFPLQHSFQRVVVDPQGRTIGKAPGVLTDDDEARETAVRAEMASHANLHRAVTVNAAIIPAVQQIENDHIVRLSHFEHLMADSPFVPIGHKSAVSLGLYAGFKMKLIESCHILVNQIEAAVRHVLKTNNVITSKLSTEGIQEERKLNELLIMPQAEDVFGPDILFDLRSLLIERFGANLRNNVSHGLVRDEEFFTTNVIYFWWLTLRSACLPLIAAQPEEES